MLHLLACEALEKLAVDIRILIEREREVEEIYLRPTDTSRLDILHAWRRLIVSCFEDVDTRCLTITEGECFIFEFCIFEIVFGGLEIIQFAISSARHDTIERITHDDEIIGVSSLRLR